MLLMSDNKFHGESCQFHKTRRKTNGLNFRKFGPRCEKTANRSLLARYCDECNGRFEALRIFGILFTEPSLRVAVT